MFPFMKAEEEHLAITYREEAHEKLWDIICKHRNGGWVFSLSHGS
tara:strand:+ start:24484 stop:24618 length:135 start_codon:yes stop_codon:yes gene_type:complete